MGISVKRAYERPTRGDGHRVLVDRLWPRGLSKQEAQIDEWVRDAAPSDALRIWFHGNRSQWSEFRRRYLTELKEHREQLRALARRARRQEVTLVYSSTDEKRNNAVILRQYLEMLERA